MKRNSLLLFFSLVALALTAQTPAEYVPQGTYKDEAAANLHRWWKGIDVSLTGGSTGIGFDVAVPLHDMVQVRTGFQIMPHASVVVNFPIQGMYKDDDGKWNQSKLDRMSEFLETFSGYKAEDNVDMRGKATYYNFKLLVDVFPFKDKRWHFTTGFYWGNSQVGEAVNVTEDAPTLLAVGMYNNFYNKFENGYFLENSIFGNLYLDPSMIYMLKDKFARYGRMGVYVGDYSHDGPAVLDCEGQPVLGEGGEPVLAYHEGDPYLMEPNADGMIKVSMKANRFKPYLGFGYGMDLDKSKSGWGVSFDAGVMFWGGSPSLITHDGTDIVNDLSNVRGKVGTISNMVKGFKVFPVLELRVTRRF